VTRSRRPLFALFASDSISLTGNVVAQVAVPWFVLETTGSAALTGVTAFFTFPPTVIALFLGGAVVDRLGFARTSVLADLASGVAVALIPVLHLTVGIELWQLTARHLGAFGVRSCNHASLAYVRSVRMQDLTPAGTALGPAATRLRPWR
jgi:hypothetical protein